MAVAIGRSDLTLEDLLCVARGGEPVELAAGATERMRAAREVVEEALAGETEVYGLTTGVNAKKAAVVDGDQGAFNRLLLASHRVGQGPPAPGEAVRATLLLLVNQLAAGWAGVRPGLVEDLVGVLNSGSLPEVRMLGSLGQGDLAPMADLTYGLCEAAGLGPIEALALIDNNCFSTALSALAVADATALLDAFDALGALDLEAFGANLSILHPEVARSRPYPGLLSTLERLRGLLEGSRLWSQGAARNLQDPLSFRCMGSVHGAARDALGYARAQLAVEMNASQGNPLVAVDERRMIPVANFDVLPLAAAVDFLRLALAPVLTGAAERTVKLLQAPLSELPQGLSAADGTAEDGLSEFGVAAAALAAEARLLAHPVSAELSTSSIALGIEDRMTMAPLAARRLDEMVRLGQRLAAVGALVATQALDLRGSEGLGAGSARAYRMVRERVSFTGVGEAPPADLEPLVELVRSGELSAR